jgi:serine/threonine protein kinase
MDSLKELSLEPFTPAQVWQCLADVVSVCWLIACARPWMSESHWEPGQGLAHMHGHAMIHMDIKPANILRSQQGVWKIADLGISAKVRSDWLFPLCRHCAMLGPSPAALTHRAAVRTTTMLVTPCTSHQRSSRLHCMAVSQGFVLLLRRLFPEAVCMMASHSHRLTSAVDIFSLGM